MTEEARVSLLECVGCSSNQTSEQPPAEEFVSVVTQAVDISRFDNGRRFGTYCQQDFENGWRPSLSDTWHMCGHFNENMSGLATRDFYWNLSGAAWHFDQSGDQEPQGGLDAVDLVFVSTHGGAWTYPNPFSAATQVMYESDQRAFSTDWRLGDEGRGLSIFAMHSCETLLPDEHVMERWGSAFDGGLRIAVGSHGSTFVNESNGSRFADNLAAGQTIKDAWANALSAASLDEDAAAMATGADYANCTVRLNGMTWNNVTSFPRRRDAQWQWLCWVTWDNL